jgi:hypothetical protein
MSVSSRGRVRKQVDLDARDPECSRTRAEECEEFCERWSTPGLTGAARQASARQNSATDKAARLDGSWAALTTTLGFEPVDLNQFHPRARGRVWHRNFSPADRTAILSAAAPLVAPLEARMEGAVG